MTNEEMIVRINEIQRNAYNGTITSADRDDWKLICLRLRMNGYKLSKRRGWDGKVVWNLKSISEVNAKRNSRFVCEWINKDMSPNHKHLKGNCTTRALAYIFENKMTYDEIEAEQYNLAAIYKTRRNTRTTWEQVATSRGYERIRLNRTIRRDRLAVMLKSITTPMISISSGHCAAIHNGAVIDKWDSRGGRVMEILVDSASAENARRILNISI